MLQVCISSGHGKYIRGAAGPEPWGLDEVDEARLVSERIADYLRSAGAEVQTFHDNTSHDQDTNLRTIVDWHNSNIRQLDISVHFNAYEATDGERGTEVWWTTQNELAANLSTAMAEAGELIDRGAKFTDSLYFLNNTDEKAVLLEICFCDAQQDCEHYRNHFDAICRSVAEIVSDTTIDEPDVEPSPPNWYDRRVLSEGDSGRDVALVQRLLGLPSDGEFGSVTSAGVTGFQVAMDLDDTGTVDEPTWDALDDLRRKFVRGDDGLDDSLKHEIVLLANNSSLNSYYWPDRGQSPPGYLAGMCLCFALAVNWLDQDKSVANVMAQADRHNPDDDALTWLRDEFDMLDMSNTGGIDTLRHLFVLLISLGMRESSGVWSCGIDSSAGESSMDADTCEAGLFQSSWNLHTCSRDIERLFTFYWNQPNGFHEVFKAAISPRADDLKNWGGSGTGVQYQWLAKRSPAFACMMTAIGCRLRGGGEGHWGPIRRKEVMLRRDADMLLQQVEGLINMSPIDPPTPPEQIPTVTIVTQGAVRILVNGVPVSDNGQKQRPANPFDQR